MTAADSLPERSDRLWRLVIELDKLAPEHQDRAAESWPSIERRERAIRRAVEIAQRGRGGQG